MSDEKSTVTLTELRNPPNKFPGGLTGATLYPSIDGESYVVRDNPLDGKGGADDEGDEAE
jgi:hypothetical protein